MPTIGGRLQRRDVDGAIRRPRADGRRLEGERDGSISRGTAASATAGLPAMAPTRSGAHGSSLPAQNPKGFFPGQGWIQSPAAVIEKPPSAGAERQPVSGGRKPSNRLPTRHPRDPSHPRRRCRRGWWRWSIAVVETAEEDRNQRRALRSIAGLSLGRPVWSGGSLRLQTEQERPQLGLAHGLGRLAQREPGAPAPLAFGPGLQLL